MSTTYTRLLLLLAILLAFALRIFALDVQSLWYDEGVTATVAQLGFVDLTRWTARDIQPPLYYYVVAAWGNLTDWREWHLRWPSVWFGVLTVPLMATLTRQIARSQTGLLLAAFFTAIHPLLVYYSQEARMYAMLTALVILCGTLLLRRNWIAFVLAATAAVYTHYFAFFLLLAIGVGYLLTRPKDEPLRPFLLANLAILILYIPWFGALFTRLAVDSSYLSGQVKLIELVRHTLITFIAGETILETRADPALLSFAMVTVVAICWLGWRAANGITAARKALILGLCWVLIPCVLILFLTLVVPKFNARYVMIALPGLLLLWSVAATDMMARKNVGRYLALAITFMLVTNFSQSIRNWFRDDAFTKAQWREVAQHVRDHKSANDAVILVSGHTWPIWDYYAPDMPAVRLPDLEILDVNATLDYAQSGSVLRAALAGQDGAWLLRWQDQFVDPMGTAAIHLDSAATQAQTDAEFWQLKLEHFTKLRPEKIDPQPPIADQPHVNFDNQLVLLGSSVNAADDLLLYWTLHENGLTSLANLPDYRIAGELLTKNGLPFHRLRDRRPVGYDFPTMRWRPGQINVSRIPALDWAGLGALPHNYSLALGVYDARDKSARLDILGPNGTPLGKQTLLPLRLKLPIFTSTGEPIGVDDPIAAISDTATLSAASAEPGEPILADVHWRMDQPVPRVEMIQIEWVGGSKTYTQQQPFWAGNNFARLPFPSNFFVNVHTVHELRVPLDAPPDQYALTLSTAGGRYSFVNEFTVLSSTRSFEIPVLHQSIGATFGNEIELLGVVDRGGADDGRATITLAWRAADQPRTDYFATIQLLDGQGQPTVQSDLALPRGSSNWLPDQVETQTFVLDAPMFDAQMLDNQRLIVAVYEPRDNFPRLLLPNGADFVVLP